MRALSMMVLLTLTGCVVAKAGDGGDSKNGNAGNGGDAIVSSVTNTVAPKTDVTAPIKPY